MTEPTGREPGLPQPSDLSGREPGLGGSRREKPVYWTGTGVLRRIEFFFGVVRSFTVLDIYHCLRHLDALLIVNDDRRILLQPYLYISDRWSRDDENRVAAECTFIGWASEGYPAPHYAALQVQVGPDLTHYRLDITALTRSSPYLSDIV